MEKGKTEMPLSLVLLPRPRQIEVLEGTYQVQQNKVLLINTDQPSRLFFSARRLKAAFLEKFNANLEIVASLALPQADIDVKLWISPEQVTRPEAYQLTISTDGIDIRGHDPAGIFYAVCTLNQIIQQAQGSIPCLRIRDWPDFLVRGVMMDVSRDKVPTMETLFDLIDRLSSWKINQFQLYTEHTFAYRNHPEVWANASPITGEEIMVLDAYCKERFIELVPNQNSFGHLHRWLIHKRYEPLAEVTEGFNTPWGWEKGPFSLAPEDPHSLKLIDSLYDELLPNFTSRTFNAGCDETFDLGQGRSKEICEAKGTGRVYIDYLNKIYRSLKRRGFRMQFWGDIIIEHPELVKELPNDLIALEWGYEAQHLFDEHGAQFAAAGVPFYVCPGTSSWLSISGRTDNALGNLLNAAENGLKHGAGGYLITDWGDRGHWQVLPVSYLGFAAGTGFSWCLETNRQMDVSKVLSQFAFNDPTGSMGRLAFELGNIYAAFDFKLQNSSPLFWVLQRSFSELQNYMSLGADTFKRPMDFIDQAMVHLEGETMSRPDAQLIRDEFRQTARLLRHSIRRMWLGMETDPSKQDALRNELANDLAELLPEYRRIWLARNRPGGLEDSVKRFNVIAEDYRI